MTVRSLAGASMGALAAVLLISQVADAAVVISSKPTKNMACSNGVCTPTAKRGVLNSTTLANMLASGDVKVVADSKAQDIEFADSLTWTSTSRLTLDSYHSILFRKPVTVAGQGALTITTNDGSTDGDFSFEKKGHIEFWDLSSSLVIKGKKYKLAKSIGELAKLIAVNPTGSYALAKSYDASQDGTYTQSPIQTNLDGIVEGLGNAIENLSIDDDGSGDIGLFAVVDVKGAIETLRLVHVDVRATHASGNKDVGTLVGLNSGRLRNDSVTGKVRGSKDVNSFEFDGGLVGENFGSIVACHSSVNVTDATFAGGLAGDMVGSSTEIIDSDATGSVSSYGISGGLVGDAESGSIVNSFASGNVDTLLAPFYIESSVGGLVGRNYANVSESFAAGNIVGGGASTLAGGLVGENYSPITNAYSIGAVNSGVCSDCGGLVGFNSASIAIVYSTGAVNASTGWTGGLIGYDNSAAGSLSDTFWDTDTSGISDPSKGAGFPANDSGITGLTDVQLKSELPTGFDPNVWGLNPNINNGYPYLLANPPPK